MFACWRQCIFWKTALILSYPYSSKLAGKERHEPHTLWTVNGWNRKTWSFSKRNIIHIHMCNASILEFYVSFETWYISRYAIQQKGSLGHRACANRRPAAMNQGDASRCFVLDVLDLEVFHGWVCLDVTFLGGSTLEDERWLPKSISYLYWKMMSVHTTCSGVVTL